MPEKVLLRAPWSRQVVDGTVFAVKDSWRGHRALVQWGVRDSDYNPPREYQVTRWVPERLVIYIRQDKS